MPEIPCFVIVRVYALIINRKKEILLTDEYQMDMRMTKFPGGGLQYGEGTIDCLKREAMEELGQELEVKNHFYTTDFFQETMFFRGYQLISIYYLAGFKQPIRFRISDRPFDFPEDVNGSQSFRWAAIESLRPEDLTFPIDRVVLKKLQEPRTMERITHGK
ncbi:MAG TPA: NUDIX domain-containing protein [Bacteroidetes bacterium]|nr:NUDIX domain-containing protein [Bacteroidota bacterium]